MHDHTVNSTWYILGCGAIGTLFAAKFLQQSIHCRLLSRHQQPDQQLMRLQVTHLDNSIEHFSINASAVSSPQPIARLMVCTKSYQTLAAIESIATRLTANASIVLLQNGMGQQQLIAERFPNLTIIAATTSVGALLNAPLEVSHTGLGKSVFGAFTEKKVPGAIIDSLSSIDLQRVPDIRLQLWNKLKINAVINPLTALYNCANGELATKPNLYRKTVQLCTEIDFIDRALDWAPHCPTLADVMAVVEATAGNYSSMQQDIIHQRPTEIEFINGYLQRLADNLKLETPSNQKLIAAILLRENTYDKS